MVSAALYKTMLGPGAVKATSGCTLGIFLMALVCTGGAVDSSVHLLFLLDSSGSLILWSEFSRVVGEALQD